jgi:hypothetical protein
MNSACQKLDTFKENEARREKEHHEKARIKVEALKQDLAAKDKFIDELKKQLHQVCLVPTVGIEKIVFLFNLLVGMLLVPFLEADFKCQLDCSHMKLKAKKVTPKMCKQVLLSEWVSSLLNISLVVTS